MQEVRIIDRGRGPEIAGTRITVYHIWEFYRAGDAEDDIALVFGLSSKQVAAAIEYINKHCEEIEQAFARYEAQSAEPPPEWVEQRLLENRKKLEAAVREKNQQPA